MAGMRLPGNGGLWSGGEDLVDYARSLGYTALEAQDFYVVTRGLRLVDDWMTGARPVWVAFSRRYAAQLRLEVHIFMRRFGPGTVLVDVELRQIAETERILSVTIELKFHAMEWGDDPTHILTDPLPGYWRELGPPPDATPLAAGKILVQSQGPAAAAVAIAKSRFDEKQAKKRRRKVR